MLKKTNHAITLKIWQNHASRLDIWIFHVSRLSAWIDYRLLSGTSWCVIYVEDIIVTSVCVVL